MATKKELTRGEKAAQTRAKNKAAKTIHAPAEAHGDIIASGMSANLEQAINNEWLATERSDFAEAALFREYQYHMLRAQELKIALEGVGYSF